MDTILALVPLAGLVGSLALVGWGMVLSLAHGLDLDSRAAVNARVEPGLEPRLPAGTLS
jgi:hypothetical protein